MQRKIKLKKAQLGIDRAKELDLMIEYTKDKRKYRQEISRAFMAGIRMYKQELNKQLEWRKKQ